MEHSAPHGSRVSDLAEYRATQGVFRSRLELTTRLAQTTAVADLSRRALGLTPDGLMRQSARVVCRTLRIEFCKIFEFDPHSKMLLMRGGYGWKKGYLGKYSVDLAGRSQTVHTFMTGRPTIVRSYKAGSAFDYHALLADHGVVSSLTVPIQAKKQRLGALSADSTRKHAFTKEDTLFLSAVAAVIGSALDRRRMEDEIHAAGERTRALLDSIRDTFFALDQDWRFVYVNRKAEDFFSKPSLALVGKMLLDELPALQGTVLLRQFEQAMALRVPIHLVQDVGDKRYEVSVYPALGGIAAFLRDITENRLAGSVIETMNAELQRRLAEREAINTELEAFCYSVSHDLRAPLRALDGFSQVLFEDYADKLDPKGKHYLQRLRSGSQRMGALIDGLLALSQIGRYDLRFERVDVSATARTICEELARLAPQRQVEVSIERDLWARADRQLVEIALRNLLDNAWKFTATQDDARIEFGKLRGDEREAFYVRDNGAGFDMTFADKLFAAFSRLHRPNEFPGTGIGLATVKRALGRLGCDVWAEGKVDHGATFYFTLPEG